MPTERSAVAALGRRLVALPGFVAGVVWTFVYSVLVITGQRFDAAYLDYGWQLIPWNVLTDDPIRSVWYLHIQPPGWNLVLGLAGWASPLGDRITVQAVMFVFGVAGAVLAARLAGRLGLGRRASTVVAIVATGNPEVLRGAFEPTYELAIGTLLLAAVLLLFRVLEATDARSITRRAVALSVVVTAVVMTRSLYHPVIIGAVLALALWPMRRFLDRRSALRLVVATLAVPLVLVGGWMAKNQMLFGTPTLSSWFGMNLQRAVIPVLDLDDLEAMHAAGEVSDIAMIGPFGDYDMYADVVEPCTPGHDHPALAEPDRSTDATSPNFNYECYLPIFEQAGRDARAVMLEHPAVWLEGRLWSLRNTFAVSMNPSRSDSVAMRLLDDVYSVARLDYRGVLSTTGWGTPVYGFMEAPTDFSVTTVLLYGVLTLLTVRALAPRRWRRRRSVVDVPTALAGLFAIFTVVVGAVGELGEQSRFRTAVDPVVVTTVVALAWCAVAGRRRGGQSQAVSVGE